MSRFEWSKIDVERMPLEDVREVLALLVAAMGFEVEFQDAYDGHAYQLRERKP